MKILKLIKSEASGYFVVFDCIPELTYEKIGSDYVGSAKDREGIIIFSKHLKKESFGGAFGGREIELNMKKGYIKTIKDYWYDIGSYRGDGEFVTIGGETLESLQECYVYSSYNINKDTFEKMVDEYLTIDRLYEYQEVEKWCNLLHKWYDVIVHGEKIPYMMNRFGTMVDKWTKKEVFSRHNRVAIVDDEMRYYTYFKFNYKENGRLIKIESNYLDVLRNTLPYPEEKIRESAKLPPVYKKKYKSLGVEELEEKLASVKDKGKKVSILVDGKTLDEIHVSETSKNILLSIKKGTSNENY